MVWTWNWHTHTPDPHFCSNVTSSRNYMGKHKVSKKKMVKMPKLQWIPCKHENMEYTAEGAEPIIPSTLAWDLPIQAEPTGMSGNLHSDSLVFWVVRKQGRLQTCFSKWDNSADQTWVEWFPLLLECEGSCGLFGPSWGTKKPFLQR